MAIDFWKVEMCSQYKEKIFHKCQVKKIAHYFLAGLEKELILLIQLGYIK